MIMRKLTEEERSGSSASDSSSDGWPSNANNNRSSSQSQQNTLKMCAKAVLTCRPNSHPFQERTLSLEQGVKIGRSVARARPCGNNAIFDCKVLSRHHALLWYENGKFYLQDTKSSNGTFVNNTRLSSSGEESLPREVCSGDIVQFGVDVMEVNKNMTHGCIVATLQLFLPDGKEAKASSSAPLSDKAPTSVQEMYQLNQFIKDAIVKEKLIEHKLESTKQLMQAITESMGVNWKALIEEDRLLTRIDILERQIECSHKTMTEEKLKEEVGQLYLDKEKYQTVAKEALRKSMQEKLDAVKRTQELEQNLLNWQHERNLLNDMCSKTYEELKELSEKYEQSELKSKELESEIHTSTTKYKEEVETLNKKLKEGEDLLLDKQKVIDALISKMDLQVAKSVLNALDDNTKLILPEVDSNKIDENLEEYKPVVDGNGEIESLKSKLVVAESEKREIQSRLMQMLNLFEDLKAVSNKVQLSEYLTELINKVDLEIHQIKNFLHAEDINVAKHITDEMEPYKRFSTPDINGLEKLLKESRETIKSLQLDSENSKHQHESLKEELNISAIKIEKLKSQIQVLADENSELKSQVEYYKEQLTQTDMKQNDSANELQRHLEIIQLKQKEIDSLKAEISQLSALKNPAPQISPKINDLSIANSYKNLDVASQTKEPSVVHKREFSHPTFDSTNLPGLMDKLLQTEEELAVFKSRYNERSAECLSLSEKVSRLKIEQESLADQSKMGQLGFIVPIVVLVLALLIVFHPSS